MTGRRATKVFFDGGCRPNPGAMEAAVVIRGAAHFRDLGQGSSEEAEWHALLAALDLAAALELPDIILLGDATGVIEQAQGRVRCRRFQALRDRYEVAIRAFEHVRLRHVPRSQNLAGIALARRRDGIGEGSLPAGVHPCDGPGS